LLSLRYALGNATTYSYDALNRQVTEQTPAGGTASNSTWTARGYPA